MTIKHNSNILVDKERIIIPTPKFLFLISILLISCWIIINAMEFHNYINYNDEFNQIEQDINISKYSVYEFSQYLDNNYNYSEFYDCKFYSYAWKKYADHHNNLYGKYIYPSDNHLMTSLHNDTHICIGNLHEVDCYN